MAAVNQSTKQFPLNECCWTNVWRCSRLAGGVWEEIGDNSPEWRKRSVWEEILGLMPNETCVFSVFCLTVMSWSFFCYGTKTINNNQVNCTFGLFSRVCSSLETNGSTTQRFPRLPRGLSLLFKPFLPREMNTSTWLDSTSLRGPFKPLACHQVIHWDWR